MRLGDFDYEGLLERARQLISLLAVSRDEDHEGEAVVKALPQRHRNKIGGKRAQSGHEVEERGVAGSRTVVVVHETQPLDVDGNEIGLLARELGGYGPEVLLRIKVRKADYFRPLAIGALMEGFLVCQVGDKSDAIAAPNRRPPVLELRQPYLHVSESRPGIVLPAAGDDTRPDPGISTLECPLGSDLSYARGDCSTEVEGLSETRLGKENQELVTTETNDLVATGEVSELPPELREQRVSRLVTVSLVHRPHVIEVEKEKRLVRPASDSIAEDRPGGVATVRRSLPSVVAGPCRAGRNSRMDLVSASALPAAMLNCSEGRLGWGPSREFRSGSPDLHRVEKRAEGVGSHVRSRATQGSKAGEDGLRLVELDGHDLSAVAGVPAQGRALEELRAAKQETELERVAQVDGRELARGREGEVHVSGLEGLLEATVRGAV